MSPNDSPVRVCDREFNAPPPRTITLDEPHKRNALTPACSTESARNALQALDP